jgi:hypothetical protein
MIYLHGMHFYYRPGLCILALPLLPFLLPSSSLAIIASISRRKASISASTSFVPGLATVVLSIALSDTGSSVIGTLRIELDMEGLLSESKLDLMISPLVRRGDKISIDDREDVLLGGGGLGGALLDFAVGVVLRVEGIEFEERFDEARFRTGGGGGDLRLGMRFILEDEPSSAGWLPEFPLRLAGGGGGAILVDDVVLSAMLSLSSISDGRDEAVPLLGLLIEGTGVL